MSLLTPAINSLNRISIGWMISYLFPGTWASFSSSSLIRSDLGRSGLGHSDRGLMIANTSATLGGMGSVAISAVPILAKT